MEDADVSDVAAGDEGDARSVGGGKLSVSIAGKLLRRRRGEEAARMVTNPRNSDMAQRKQLRVTRNWKELKIC